MSVYVLMTKLAPGNLQDAASRKGKGRDWLQKVNQACPGVKWIAHYALLGRSDFMDIYEAPDELTAHKVSLVSRSEGALSAESWQALPYDEHLALMDDIGS